jgi:hypothetical protein
MKNKLLAAFVLAFFSATAFAADFDAAAYKDASMKVLLGWSGASIAGGTAMTVTGNSFVRGVGIQSVAWGAIDMGIALYAGSADNVLGIDLTKKKGLYDLFFINFLLDILYMGAGTALWVWGKDEWKGHGAGILLQGGFLFAFDGINALLLTASF